MIPFGPFEPDKGPTIAGLCMQANGVLPKASSYGPFPGPSVPTDAGALSAAPRGGMTLRLNDGTWRRYQLTADKLYLLSADYSWTEIDDGFTGPDAGQSWSCVHFGKYLLATNVNDGMWAFNVEAGGGGTYITDAGDPRFIFVANDQIIALDCIDSSGNRDNRLIKTSSFGRHDRWKGDGADYQPLDTGGALQAGGDLLGNTALILQDSYTRLMRLGNQGNGRFFTLETISAEVGTVSSDSAVFRDGTAAWLATDGWCMFAGSIKRIGATRVDGWFLNRADQSALDLVQGSVDPFNKVLVWRWKRENAVSDTVFNDLLIYSWLLDRWTTASVTTTALLRFATPGYGVDDYDAPVDSVDLPVDDRFWYGGQPLFGVLDGDLKVALLAGAPVAATLETSVANNPVTGLLQWCTPNTDAANATVQVGVSDRLQEAMTWWPAAPIGESGMVPLDGRGLNVAFRLNIPAAEDWSDARGIDHVRGSQGGRR